MGQAPRHDCLTVEYGQINCPLSAMRKANVEQRRRDLCDAAIALLAEDGARGLTHLRVDRRAGVADGTTSFYYQTRSALLRGVTSRVVQLDADDFIAAMNAIKAPPLSGPMPM
jgi:DNA-binding transcriptional regulator YbjK